MTLIALTQEPEVKVRLAMIGKWCLRSCFMLRERPILDDGETYCVLYGADDDDGLSSSQEGYLRCPACIAAHGGAE